MKHEPSYSLCEALRTAGFSQEPTSGGDFYWTPEGWIFTEKIPKKWSGIWFRMPTLDQLIEACGDCVVLHNLSSEWEAGIGDKHSCGSNYIDTMLKHTERGATPVEAVAKLWLSLR